MRYKNNVKSTLLIALFAQYFLTIHYAITKTSIANTVQKY